MDSPTTRVLTVLDMLQSHPVLTGAEIAARLDVDIRTARRYIAMLEELGVPVTADRGRQGGYRLMPGFKLPPLMLTEDEALALTLGLRAARRLGLFPQASGVEGALAKVERVLPAPVRDRVRAVEQTLAWERDERREAGIESQVILALGAAARAGQQVRLTYRDAQGAETERIFDPYGLVAQWKRWYAVGHCHLRGSLRLFRLDRITRCQTLATVFERPVNFDSLAALQATFRSIPTAWSVEVVLETTLERARWHLWEGMAILEEQAEGKVLLRANTDCLEGMARRLACLGCPLQVRQPPELRAALQQHAAQIAQWAAPS